MTPTTDSGSVRYRRLSACSRHSVLRSWPASVDRPPSPGQCGSSVGSTRGTDVHGRPLRQHVTALGGVAHRCRTRIGRAPPQRLRGAPSVRREDVAVVGKLSKSPAMRADERLGRRQCRRRSGRSRVSRSSPCELVQVAAVDRLVESDDHVRFTTRTRPASQYRPVRRTWACPVPRHRDGR
jgi:hypothetical protein